MLPQSSGYEGQECPEGDLGSSDQAPLSCLCSKYLTGGNRIIRFPDSNRHRASAATVQIQLICNKGDTPRTPSGVCSEMF